MRAKTAMADQDRRERAADERGDVAVREQKRTDEVLFEDLAEHHRQSNGSKRDVELSEPVADDARDQQDQDVDGRAGDDGMRTRMMRPMTTANRIEHGILRIRSQTRMSGMFRTTRMTFPTKRLAMMAQADVGVIPEQQRPRCQAVHDERAHHDRHGHRRRDAQGHHGGRCRDAEGVVRRLGTGYALDGTLAELCLVFAGEFASRPRTR